MDSRWWSVLYRAGAFPVEQDMQNNISFYSEMGNRIDYYFMAGNNMDGVIANYRELTGRRKLCRNGRWVSGKAVSDIKRRMNCLVY